MPTYLTPPGAWLGGAILSPPISGNSPLHPPIQRSAGLHPGIGGNAWLHPPVGGNAPLHPGIGGGGGRRGLWPADPADPVASGLAAAAERLTVASPWRGGPTDWVYGDSDASLFTEALRRTQATLVRETDPRREGDETRIRRPEGWGRGPDTLWRWGDDARNHTLLCDLQWRFRVIGGSSGPSLQCLADQSVAAGDRWLTSMTIRQDDLVDDEQIDKVMRAAVEREDRLPEILAQAQDILPFFLHIAGLSPAQAPITCNLLALAQAWATPLVMGIKHEVAGLRPYMVSTRIVPLIDTPAHGALPSGHATIAALLATLLRALMNLAGTTGPSGPNAKSHQLDRLARRVAFNRVVAGVHFPVDSRVGYALGLQLAAHLMALADPATMPPAPFDPLPPPVWGKAPTLKEQGMPRWPGLRTDRAGVGPSELLGAVWVAACKELQLLGLRDAGRQTP